MLVMPVSSVLALGTQPRALWDSQACTTELWLCRAFLTLYCVCVYLVSLMNMGLSMSVKLSYVPQMLYVHELRAIVLFPFANFYFLVITSVCIL